MKHILSALIALVLSTQGAFAQGAVQPGNLFWATPLSTTGNLSLRAIGLADLSATITNVPADTLLANPTGSAAAVQPVTVGAAFIFSGTALQTVAMSGDLTTPANSFVTTLNTVNSNVGSFGSVTAVPNFTVNAKGLITAAGSSTLIYVGSFAVASLPASPATGSMATATDGRKIGEAHLAGTGIPVYFSGSWRTFSSDQPVQN
jgi:hypothetical protein